jgi:endonuclease IV
MVPKPAHMASLRARSQTRGLCGRLSRGKATHWISAATSFSSESFERCAQQAQQQAAAGLSQHDAAHALAQLAEEGSLTGVCFQEVLSVIDQCFDHNPSAAYSVGSRKNEPGENIGSAKVFHFASMLSLSETGTLNLFCEHYQRVLDEPEGSSHQNIREFMHHGWPGIEFHGRVLLEKGERVDVAAVDEV